MARLPEHNRATRAANADLLGEEAVLVPPEADQPPRAGTPGAARSPTEGKPGKDINQAGFLKDDADGRP